MAGLSRYAAQALFDRTLNPSTRERATYLALHKASIDDETYGGEADYIGYLRQPLNSMFAVIEVGADGEVTLVAKNGNRVTYPFSGGAINLITHWAIWDNATVGEGNVLYSGALVNSRIIEHGDAAIVRPEELVVYFI